MKQYIVDAFISQPFSGNPAAVCIMDGWPEDESMMKLARVAIDRVFSFNI